MKVIPISKCNEEDDGDGSLSLSAWSEPDIVLSILCG